MSERVGRAIAYALGDSNFEGYLVTGSAGGPRPGVLLLHDSFGITPMMKELAHRIANLGSTVFLADLWSGGKGPLTSEQIDRRLAEMSADPAQWMGRVSAAHATMLEQPEVADGAALAVGYGFGGSSVLEYVRSGGDFDAVVTFHPGLDLVSRSWSPGGRSLTALIFTGAADSLATTEMVNALAASLTSRGADWEIVQYGGAKHGFTSPIAFQLGDAFAYDAEADHHSWRRFEDFFLDWAAERSGDAGEDTSGVRDGEDIDEVLLAERERCRAISEQDWGSLAALLDDAVVYTHATGRVDDKAALIASLKAQPRRVTRDDPQVRLLGDAALVTGTQSVESGDASILTSATSVWRRGGPGWLLVAFHASRLV